MTDHASPPASGADACLPVNRRVVLAARPRGKPDLDDFAIVSAAVLAPQEGEVLLQNLFLSLDPAQRSLMSAITSSVAPIAIGECMPGATVAVVRESRHPEYRTGEHVVSRSGWQEFAVSDTRDLRKIDDSQAPLSASLGILGSSGHTAWVGLTKVIELRPAATLVVTAASGAVGSAAVQIGKRRGLRVVAIARGPEKQQYMRDVLGADAAVDACAVDFEAQLAAALPDGADAVFENVGASMIVPLLPHLNERASIAICGTISHYNLSGQVAGPDNLPALLCTVLWKRLTMRGFSLSHHAETLPQFLAEVGPWVGDGSIHFDEDIVDGIEAVPQAFLRLFEGKKPGKLIARLDGNRGP